MTLLSRGKLALGFAVILISGLLVMTLAVVDAANAVPEESKIKLDQIKTQELVTGPYSYFVPPYSYYYFHNMDQLGFQLDWVQHAEAVFKLKEPVKKFTVNYTYKNHTYALDEYFKRNAVTGFLILKDDQIIFEKYFYGADQNSRFISNSVGKSITSTLFGVALEEGKIASVDDLVIKYVPELKGSAFERVTLKQTLEMATGIIASEDAFDPNSTVHLMDESVLHGKPSFMQVLKMLKENPNEKPGSTFNYTSLNTEVLGFVIEKATGMPLNKYLEEKIWKKIGTQSDAFFYRAKAQPDQCAFGCFNSTVRDYGRFGLMMMNGGTLAGNQVVSENWVKEATTPAKFATPLQDSENLGYGYQWWIPSDGGGAYKGMGIFGQILYINPEKHIVIMQTAAWPRPEMNERWEESSKLMAAIVTAISK